MSRVGADGLQRVRVELDLQAEVGSVWRALLDIERFPDYMESVSETRVLSDVDGIRTTEWSVVLRGSILRWTERAVIDEAGRAIRFEQVEGDLSVFRGRWVLRDLGGGATRASLEVDFEIGIPLLARMLNPVATSSLESNTVAMLRALEREAQAGCSR